MEYLDSLRPGKRENAFYVKADAIDVDRVGVQSEKNRCVFAYVWDEKKKKHVGRYINREQYDDVTV